jgi:hypothetical protein
MVPEMRTRALERLGDALALLRVAEWERGKARQARDSERVQQEAKKTAGLRRLGSSGLLDLQKPAPGKPVKRNRQRSSVPDALQCSTKKR